MPKDNNSGDGKDFANDKISELLADFYKPIAGMQDFDDFFAGIEKKLENSDPLKQIAKANEQILKDYEKREEKLQNKEPLKKNKSQRKEVKLPKIHQKKKKTNYKTNLAFVALCLLMILGATCVNAFKADPATKYILLSDENIHWSSAIGQ